MTAQAGWYDDGTGRKRWWDGSQWSDHYEARESATAPAAPIPPSMPAEIRPKRVVPLSAFVISVVGAFAIGALIATAGSSVGRSSTAAPAGSSSEVARLNALLDERNETIESLKAADEKAGGDIAAREAAADAREEQLDERETAISAAEQQAAGQTFGNGLFVVGTTFEPGVYTTAGPDGTNSAGCYYVWKSGTGSDAQIVDNNIVNGAATVTLNAGEVFESSSCQAWTKVG